MDDLRTIRRLILGRFIKFAIIPIVVIEATLAFTLFVLNQYQNIEIKSEIENISFSNFNQLSSYVADNIELQIDESRRALREIQILTEQIYSNRENFSNPNLELIQDRNFVKDIQNGNLSSIYAVDSTLSKSTRDNLEPLSLLKDISKLIVDSYQIESIWINIDKRYNLSYPYVDLTKEIDSDFIKSKLEFLSSVDRGLKRDYLEPWAIKSGDILSFIAPVRVRDTIGKIRVNLSISKIVEYMNSLELPFNSYLILLDKDGVLIASSNEERSFKEFYVKSFYRIHKESTGELIDISKSSKINLNLIQEEKILFNREISDTGLKIAIISDSYDIFKNVEATLQRTKDIGYTALTLIGIFYLIFFIFMFEVIKSLAKKIVTPIKNILNFSKSLGMGESIELEDSKIEELNQLNNSLKSVNDKLSNMLIRDNLTTLFNRRKLIYDIETLDIATLIIFDLAQFKNLNSVYGNEVGDFILKQTAYLLKSQISQSCKLYRSGADEFSILIPTESEESIIETLNTLIANISEQTILYSQDIEISLNFSIGIAFKSKNREIDLFAKANIALNDSKEKGLKYSIYDSNLHSKEGFEKNLFWAKKLNIALKERQVLPYFQPIYNLKTKKVEKFESLVRIEERGKVISPFFFLESAKNIGKLNDLTKVMIDEVFRVANEYRDFEFSLNISFKNFEDSNMIEHIKTTLKRYSIDTSKVIFEILETEALLNQDTTDNFLRELKELGFKIAIDDFGSGYSNFAHILNINIDYIKIDEQFIKDIVSNRNSYVISKTIIDFAKLIDVETVAEFVESREIVEKVEYLRVDYIQGYFISAPMGERDLREFIDNLNKD